MHDTERVMREYFELLRDGRPAEAFALYADDVILHVPGRHPLAGDHEGKGAVLAYNDRVREATAGTFGVTPHDILGSEEHAVMLGEVRAEVDGEPVTWRRVTVCHVRDGKVSEIWFHDQDADVVERVFA